MAPSGTPSSAANSNRLLDYQLLLNCSKVIFFLLISHYCNQANCRDILYYNLHSLFVAIDTATRKERSDFLTEIEMMKKISEGYNNHIVNLVGCVTIQEPLCLITEFVPHGDLLDYLRNQRKKVYCNNYVCVVLIMDKVYMSRRRRHSLCSCLTLYFH